MSAVLFAISQLRASTSIIRMVRQSGAFGNAPEVIKELEACEANNEEALHLLEEEQR